VVADPTAGFVPFQKVISDVGRMSYAKQAASGRTGAVRDAAAFACVARSARLSGHDDACRLIRGLST
jgi:hypothetical protein